MVSVLLTRPQNTSAQLAKELQRLGYKTIIEPLLTIIPTNAQRPATTPQAVIITSANALVALEENNEDADDLLDLPCFCVGPRTADKARAFGFSNVLNSNSDGAELAQLVTAALKDKNKALLHIAGEHTDSKASSELQAAGYHVITWPIYRADAATQLSPQTIERMKKQELDAVLLYSPRTAATLQGLIAGNALEACCGHMIAIGLSDAVTARLKPLSWRQLLAAAVPAEDAVIACLQKTLPV